MKRHVFKTHSDYVAAQLNVTRVKIEGSTNSLVDDDVAKAMRQWYADTGRDPTKVNGCCHGVRLGEELSALTKHFGGLWVGTEITPELCNGVNVIHADFTQVRQEWVGAFDVIYSNSLDHARDPFKTLKIWSSCVARNGYLAIDWTRWHAKLGKRTPRFANRADCFAANAEEYRTLLSEFGDVLAIWPIPDSDRRIFMVKV